MFRPLPTVCAALTAASLTAPAHADLRVSFIEGAPKDRFEILNTGACAITASAVQLDLSTSQGALIFDVTSAGAGVEVFQPFEVVRGADALSDIPTVVDGQDMVKLDIADLAPGAAIAFTIDVDDTLGAREITVTGSEIAGATVSHMHESGTETATFSSNARAKLNTASC